MNKLLLILLCLPMIGFGQTYFEYYENGQIKEEKKINSETGNLEKYNAWWSNGELQSTEEFDEDGNSILSKSFYENGQIQSLQNHGELNDTLKTVSWYENGNVLSKFISILFLCPIEHYEKEVNLVSEHWYENGQIRKIWDEENKVRKLYYENGQIRIEKNEKIESYYEKNWSLDGKLIYLNCDTLSKAWNDKGKLVYECNFTHPKGNIVGYDTKGIIAYNINYILTPYQRSEQGNVLVDHQSIRWPNSGHWRTNTALLWSTIDLIGEIKIFHAEWKDKQYVVKTPKILYYEAFFNDTEDSYDISGWEKYYYDNGQIRQHEIFESGESVYRKQWFSDGKIKSEIRN